MENLSLLKSNIKIIWKLFSIIPILLFRWFLYLRFISEMVVNFLLIDISLIIGGNDLQCSYQKEMKLFV